MTPNWSPKLWKPIPKKYQKWQKKGYDTTRKKMAQEIRDYQKQKLFCIEVWTPTSLETPLEATENKIQYISEKVEKKWSKWSKGQKRPEK